MDNSCFWGPGLCFPSPASSRTLHLSVRSRLIGCVCPGRWVSAGRAVVISNFGKLPDPPLGHCSPLHNRPWGGLTFPSPTAAQATPAALHRGPLSTAGPLPPCFAWNVLLLPALHSGLLPVLFFPPDFPRQSFGIAVWGNSPTQAGRTLF